VPWEVAIRLPDNADLGEVGMVRDRIAAAVPGIRFYMEPSGPEQLAAAREAGIEFPDVIRQHLEERPATLQGDFEGTEFSMQLYGFESRPLQTIYVEVRGNGNPIPALAALCKPNGWVAVDCASRQCVDFEGKAATGWEAFRNYRDRSISRILGSEGSA
jgi:hypothetical protein